MEEENLKPYLPHVCAETGTETAENVALFLPENIAIFRHKCYSYHR
jgi:hypothetical protein